MKIEMQTKDQEKRKVLGLKLTFDPDSLRLIRTPFGLVIELEGCRLSGQQGGPGLPSQVVRLALPPNTHVTEVTAEAEKAVRLTEKPELLAPLQPFRRAITANEPSPQFKVNIIEDAPIKHSTSQPRSEVFVKPPPPPPFMPPRAELYEGEAKKPRPLARLINTEQIGPVPVAVLEVTPIRLIENGLLEFAPEIKVTVRYDEQDSPPEFVRITHSHTRAKLLVEMARAKVVNPEAVWDFSRFFGRRTTQVDYLIITDNQTWDQATLTPTGSVDNLVQAFQRLADWKAKRELKSRVVTVSEIVSGKYGDFKSGVRDLQEVIRNFLKWALREWGISWVLLGGDIDIIPVRRVAGTICANIEVESTNPPADNKSFWTGTFLKMKTVGDPHVWWGGADPNDTLVRPDTGLIIPYDAVGSSSPANPGWYFCTDNTSPFKVM